MEYQVLISDSTVSPMTKNWEKFFIERINFFIANKDSGKVLHKGTISRCGGTNKNMDNASHYFLDDKTVSRFKINMNNVIREKIYEFHFILNEILKIRDIQDKLELGLE